MVKMTRYRKRYINYGKPTFTKNPYQMPFIKSGANMAIQKAGQALAVANSVRNLLNPEFKYHEVYSSATRNNTGDLILLNGLQKGTTNSTRMARSILIKSVNLTVEWTVHASATLGSECRVIIFIDKAPSGVAPNITDLVDTGTITVRTLAQRNLDFRKRFVILKDVLLHVSNDGPERRHVEYYNKLKMHTVYDASDAGTIADISNNALYAFLVSNEPTNVPTGALACRIRYLDN